MRSGKKFYLYTFFFPDNPVNGFRRRKDFKNIYVRPIAIPNLRPWLGLFTHTHTHAYTGAQVFERTPLPAVAERAKALRLREP